MSPTLTNLEEAEEDDIPHAYTTRQHSYPVTSAPSVSPGSSSSRFKLQTTISSPSVLASSSSSTRGIESDETRRSDIYAQFIKRYRQPTNDFSSQSGSNEQDGYGLGGTMLDDENSDDDDPSMSRMVSKGVGEADGLQKSLRYDEWVEPANQAERERLEWQAMLTSVLDGDVLKSEKTRIAVALESTTTDRRENRHNDIWLGLKANLRGVSDAEEKRILEDEKRRYVDTLVQDVINFRIEDEECAEGADWPYSAINQVGLVLRRLDAIEDLYPTLRSLYNDKPLCASQDFRVNRAALITWINTASAIRHQITSVTKWTGSEFLEIMQPDTTVNGITSPRTAMLPSEVANASTFVERVLKEDSMQRMFEKKTLTTLHSFLLSTRESLVAHASTFQKLNLPSFQTELVKLISLPSRLVEAIMRVRLDYATKVTEPETLIIDQMTDDFRIAIGLACTIRTQYENHIRPDPSGGWNLPPCISDSYDDVIIQGTRFLFKLINWKFQTTSVDDVNIMETHGALFDEISVRIRDGSSVVAEELCSLTTKLIVRVSNAFSRSVKLPENRHAKDSSPQVHTQNGGHRNQRAGAADLTAAKTTPPGGSMGSPLDERSEERLLTWFSDALDEIRLPHGKLMRFARVLSQRFSNSAEFSLANVNIDAFICRLVATQHFLVYTQSFEEDGIYIVAHPSLTDHPEAIRQLLRKAYHINDLSEQPALRQRGLQRSDDDVQDDDENEGNDSRLIDVPYLLLLTPTERFLWNGLVQVVGEPRINFGLDAQRARLIADGPHIRLAMAKEAFIEICTNSDDEATICDGSMQCLEESLPHLDSVNKELRRVSKSLTRITEVIVGSIDQVQVGLQGVSKRQELVASWFSFASEHAKQVSRYITPASRARINNKLTKLAIDWVAFICDECDHTDRKTFRLAVQALEFAHLRTRRNNILHITDVQFNLLRQKVATCMTLLISHFDILGARSSLEMKQEKLRAQEVRRLQAVDGRIRVSESDSLSRPPTPEQGRTSLYGPLNSTFKRKTRLDSAEVLHAIDEVDEYRSAVDTEQNLVGRVLDIGIPEDRSLVDLVTSTSRISIRWQQGRFIGAGAFGTVYQAINLTTGTLMAVKEIRYQEISGSNLFNQIKDELAVMELLHHPNVVEFYGIEAHRDRVYIFEEYCQGGSLARLLEHGRIEDESIMQVYTLQMLEGLIYLHSKGIIHRDVKPDNILLDHMGVIKFVDFGAAKVLAKNQRTIQRTRRGASPSAAGSSLTPGLAMNNSLTGTPMYMAPEVIRNDKRGQQGAMDIWSLGCVVMECATGRKPWSNLDNEWAIMFHIGVATKHPPLPDPDQLSLLGIDFIKRCLTLDPILRPTATDLVHHAWMLDFRAQMEEYENAEEPQQLLSEANKGDSTNGQGTVTLNQAATPHQGGRETANSVLS